MVGQVIYLIIVLGVIYCALLCHADACTPQVERAIERNYEAQINEAKLQFFINISHEIRTPMTLVMSPLQKLMASDDNPARQKDYRTISRNAKRVLRLVNELMDIRENRQGGKMMLSFTVYSHRTVYRRPLRPIQARSRQQDITLTF